MKQNRNPLMSKEFKRNTLTLAIGLALSSMACANPTGMNVVAGQATSQALGDLLKVTNSPGAVIQWQQFNIGANQTTQFIQQNAASQVFNKVVGGDVSQILGNLKSNGQVFLINPAGVIFGQGAVIDTAGFVASALAASTADLVNGHLKFEGDPASNASIQNLGTLTTHSGGSIVLIAPNIQNSGIIHADGEVLLAAGHQVTIVDLNHPTVGLNVQAQAGGQAVNLGDIVGKNASVFASLINNSGVVEATGVQQGTGGVIHFVSQGNTVLSGTSSLNASGGAGGQVNLQSVAGDTIVDGQVTANGQTGVGGSVQLTGQRVAVLEGATVQADGASGGGAVHIGGGWQGKNASIANAQQTVVQSGAQVSANAIDNGNGGEVVAWADGRTQVDASLQARGGINGGNGGRVETSGKELLQVSKAADTSAPKGQGGEWLLDPANLNVVDTLPTSSPPPQTVPPPDPSFQPPGYFSTGNQTGDSYILASTIKQGLEFGNGSVTLSTRGSAAGNGDININAPILVDQPTLYPQPELTLDAAGTININSAIGINPNASGFNGFSLNLSYDINRPVFINAPLYLGGVGILNLAPFDSGLSPLTGTGFVDGVNFGPAANMGAANPIATVYTSPPISGGNGPQNIVPIVRMNGSDLQIGNILGDINSPPGIDLRLLNGATLGLTSGSAIDRLALQDTSTLNVMGSLSVQDISTDAASTLNISSGYLQYGHAALAGTANLTGYGYLDGVDTQLTGVMNLITDPLITYGPSVNLKSLKMGASAQINADAGTYIALGQSYNSQYSATTPIVQYDPNVPLSSTGGQFVADSGASINMTGLAQPGVAIPSTESFPSGVHVDLSGLDNSLNTPVTFNVTGYNNQISSYSSQPTSMPTMSIGPQVKINVQAGAMGPSLHIGEETYSYSNDSNGRYDSAMNLAFSGQLNVGSGGVELYGANVSTAGASIAISGSNSGIRLNGKFTSADIYTINRSNGAGIQLTGLWDNSAVTSSNAATSAPLNKGNLRVNNDLTIEGGVITGIDPTTGLSNGKGIKVGDNAFLELRSTTLSGDIFLEQGSAMLLASQNSDLMQEIASPVLNGAKIHMAGDSAVVVETDALGQATLTGKADFLTSGQGNLLLAGRRVFDASLLTSVPDTQTLNIDSGITLHVQDATAPGVLTTGLGLVYPNGPSSVPARPGLLVGQLTEQAVATYEIQQISTDSFGNPIYATTDLINPTSTNPTPGFPSSTFVIDGSSDSYNGGSLNGVNGTLPTYCAVSDTCVKFQVNQSVNFNGRVLSDLSPSSMTTLDTSGVAFSSGLVTPLANISYLQNTPTELRFLQGTNTLNLADLQTGQSVLNMANLVLPVNAGAQSLTPAIVNNGILVNNGQYVVSNALGGTGQIDNAGTLTFNNASGAATVSNVINNSGMLINQGNTTFSGSLSGPGGFTNSGTLTLTSTQPSVLGTLSNSGSVNNQTSTTILGALSGAGTLNNTGTLVLADTSGATLTNSIVNNGALENSGVMTYATGVTGTGVFANNGSLTLSSTANSVFSNVLSNNGSLTNNGSYQFSQGLFSVSGLQNNGAITLLSGSSSNIASGALNNGVINNAGSTTLGGIISGTGSVSNSGTLNIVDSPLLLAGFNGPVGGLQPAAILTSFDNSFSNTATGTLTLSGGNTGLAFTNSFSNSGSISFLPGTYSFAQGYSQTGGNLAFGPGVNVMADVSLTGPSVVLMGNTTINGNLTVNGATVSPGNSPGLITVNGDLTLNSQSNTNIQFQSNNGVPGVDYDFIQVNGVANLAGALNLYDISNNGAGGGLLLPESFNFIQANSFNGAFGSVTNYLPTTAYSFSVPTQVQGASTQLALQVSTIPFVAPPAPTSVPSTSTTTGSTLNQNLQTAYFPVQDITPAPPPPSGTSSPDQTQQDQAKQTGDQTLSGALAPPNTNITFLPIRRDNPRIGATCQ